MSEEEKPGLDFATFKIKGTEEVNDIIKNNWVQPYFHWRDRPYWTKPENDYHGAPSLAHLLVAEGPNEDGYISCRLIVNNPDIFYVSRWEDSPISEFEDPEKMDNFSKF